MAHGVNNKTGSGFLAVALTAILVLGGVLAACSRAPTSTSVTTRTTTSSLSTTTSAPATTSTSAPATTTSAPASTATGVSAADFYKANIVTAVVPYAPGGGVDYAARLLASYWTGVTGGRMIIDNKVGAAGLLAANTTYAAKPDGLTLGVGMPGPGLISPTLAQDPAVKFDIKKMNWIGFVNPEAYVLVVSSKSPYNSMQDILKVKGFKFGAVGRSSTVSFAAAIIIDVFGLQDARIVLGYSGTAEAILAVAKGEVDSYVSSALLDSVNKGFVKQPLLNIDFQRNPYFPEVPNITELSTLSRQQENLLRIFIALGGGQIFWFQPGVPQDRIDFVRNAFDKIVANETFVKQAKTYWPVWAMPTAGKAYAAEMEKILAVATPESFNELQTLTNKYIP